MYLTVDFGFASLWLVHELVPEILHFTLRCLGRIPNRVVQKLNSRAIPLRPEPMLDLRQWNLPMPVTVQYYRRHVLVELGMPDDWITDFTPEHIFLLRQMLPKDFLTRKIIAFLCVPRRLWYFDVQKYRDFIRYAMYAVIVASRRVDGASRRFYGSWDTVVV